MHLTARRSLARFVATAPVTARSRAQFHATSAVMVKVGDRIPDLDLVEDSPGNVSTLESLRHRCLAHTSWYMSRDFFQLLTVMQLNDTLIE